VVLFDIPVSVQAMRATCIISRLMYGVRWAHSMFLKKSWLNNVRVLPLGLCKGHCEI
jgi:hypothetical protein